MGTKKEKKQTFAPERVVVHYTCPECGAEDESLLKEITSSAYICDECDNMDNFLEITSVSIMAEKPGKKGKGK